MKERWDSFISISREGDGQVPHEYSSPSFKFLFSTFTGIDDIKRNVFPPSLHRRGPFFGVLGTIRLFWGDGNASLPLISQCMGKEEAPLSCLFCESEIIFGPEEMRPREACE